MREPMSAARKKVAKEAATYERSYTAAKSAFVQLVEGSASTRAPMASRPRIAWDSRSRMNPTPPAVSRSQRRRSG
jgi:hypothetical protein